MVHGNIRVLPGKFAPSVGVSGKSCFSALAGVAIRNVGAVRVPKLALPVHRRRVRDPESGESIGNYDEFARVGRVRLQAAATTLRRRKWLRLRRLQTARR
jgi:hypothetical protein